MLGEDNSKRPAEEDYFLPDHERPKWLEYPYAFKTLIDWRIFEILNWEILEAKRSLVWMNGLSERYPSRKLFPFAFRRQNDDVACWSKDTGEKVFIVHDFASPGWEQHEILDTVGDWLRFVVDDFIDWEPLPDPADARE